MEDLASRLAYRAVVVFQLFKGEPLDALAHHGAIVASLMDIICSVSLSLPDFVQALAFVNALGRD